jgi:hypothetical protein
MLDYSGTELVYYRNRLTLFRILWVVNFLKRWYKLKTISAYSILKMKSNAEKIKKPEQNHMRKK